MKVLGIVGGIASGKSLIAAQFSRLGAAVLDGDEIAHQVLGEATIKKRIRSQWGSEVFHDSGEVSRSALAAIVFDPSPAGREQLSKLEAIMHPRIAEHLNQRIAQLRQARSVPALVLDAAVMLEAGWDRHCDAILFVDAPVRLRRERARSRGWDDAQWQMRENAQMPLDEKRRRCDRVIDNSGDSDSAFRQVKQIWHELVESGAAGPCHPT